MPLPIIGTATEAVKSVATNAIQTAIPTSLVAGADVIQGNQEKKIAKIKVHQKKTNDLRHLLGKPKRSRNN